MGFLQPSPPPFDLEEWKRQPFLTRLKANAQDWAVNGFGTPGAVYLLYIVKLAFYFVGGLLLIGAHHAGARRAWATSPTGGASRSSSRSSPCGRSSGRSSGSGRARCRSRCGSPRRSEASSTGCGRGPCACRRSPDKVPLTRGFRRTPLDVALYARRDRRGRLPRSSRTATPQACASTRPAIARAARPARRCWACATRSRSSPRGPRSTASSCSSRSSRCENLIPGWQFVFFFIWWGAAASKLNRHFPYVIQVMISQHALEPVAPKFKATDVPRLPGGPAAVEPRGPRGAPRHRVGVRHAAAPDRSRTAARSARSP